MPKVCRQWERCAGVQGQRNERLTDLAPQILKEQHWDVFGVSNVEGGSAGWPRFKSTALFACFGGQILWIRLKDPNDYLFCDTGALWSETVTEWQFDFVAIRAGQNCQGAF